MNRLDFSAHPGRYRRARPYFMARPRHATPLSRPERDWTPLLFLLALLAVLVATVWLTWPVPA